MSHRGPWVLPTVVLAVVGAALLFWALTTQSDLDSTRHELDVTIEELDRTKQDVEEIALHIPGDGSSPTPALKARRSLYDEVAAQLDAAYEDLPATVGVAAAAACAKASIAALGGLFEGDNARDQAAAVREELQRVVADCKADLAGE